MLGWHRANHAALCDLMEWREAGSPLQVSAPAPWERDLANCRIHQMRLRFNQGKGGAR